MLVQEYHINSLIPFSPTMSIESMTFSQPDHNGGRKKLKLCWIQRSVYILSGSRNRGKGLPLLYQWKRSRRCFKGRGAYRRHHYKLPISWPSGKCKKTGECHKAAKDRYKTNQAGEQRAHR